MSVVNWTEGSAGMILDHLETFALADLMAEAERLTVAHHQGLVTYSPKIFLPLTTLCRDVCHYCTFAQTPSQARAPYLALDEVLEIARIGEAAGCREALFTLGDRPEDRYVVAREWLDRHGYHSTLDYVRAAAAFVLKHTGLLPHLNPGLMAADDYRVLRPVSVSMGLMLESTSERLCARGMPHHGSPDKAPAARLESIRLAGEAQVPFTSGLLIGIGETRLERIEALLALRDLNRRYGHIQEVIIQNFRAKAGTRMAGNPDLGLDEHLFTIAAARLILGPEMRIQAPPNLQPDALPMLLAAGVNDWGGVSPVTPDHVNPEAPWPALDTLRRATESAGRTLVERLAIGPAFARDPGRWLDEALVPRVRRSVDARGLPIREEWRAGGEYPAPALPSGGLGVASGSIDRIIARACRGERLGVADIVRLFGADGPDVQRIADAADGLRQDSAGDAITYVVNRNINYTNICLYHCTFCAFSKGGTRDLRGPGYLLDEEEVGRLAAEAVARGATEVCMQGGIHPKFDGRTYHRLIAAVRAAAPDVHIHAFSPLEIVHGARTLRVPLADYLASLRDMGLSTLPGTAAEILDEDIRAIICPDKVSGAEWLEVMRTAHGVGLRSTATIMFGHVEQYDHWARHLLAIRDLQAETGGFTEFVPLPFVHMEAPMWRKGQARSGPSFCEALLMHAVARLVLHPLVPNIQASWVKMGEDGVIAALRAGANDLGGVLMNESITRAAGGRNGQCYSADRMHAIAERAGRPARQRTTLYAPVNAQLPLPEGVCT